MHERTSKHTTDLLFATSNPSAFSRARRLIGAAIADRQMRAQFGGLNTCHTSD